MKGIWTLKSLGLLIFMIGGAAVAQPATSLTEQTITDQSKTTGIQIYAGGIFGLSRISLNSQVSNTTKGSTINLTNGHSFFGGVMLNQYWGVEMDYFNFGDDSDTYSGTAFKTTYSAWGLYGKGMYTFDNSAFSVYAKLGLNQIELKTVPPLPNIGNTTTKYGLGAAIGLGYALTQHINLSTGLNIISFTSSTPSTTNDVNYALLLYGVSLKYQF